jgi:hypothetical protein
VDYDRQAIERRDFPIGRRGYDIGAVDAHLRGLAAEFEELQRTAATGGRDLSLASSASTQVQAIIEAAELAAGEIERNAQDHARQLTEDASRAAERTREEALEKARSHVAAVAQMTATLLERVGSMDSEVNALIGSLRAGAGRLAADLTAVDAGMGELYGAASGRSTGAQPNDASQQAPAATPPSETPAQAAPAGAAQAALAKDGAAQPSPPTPPPAAAQPPKGTAAADVDGARLIALNMALNGESRSDTDRYLAENFELPDRGKLVDEVYAAIEG